MQPKNNYFFQTVFPWIVIFFSSLFLIYKYILQVYPSIMTNELMMSFHVHGAGLGNLAAMFFYSYLIAQLFVGLLLDRYSPRKLTAFAIFLSALGAFGFANAHLFWTAATSRILMGIGVAFATVSYMKMAAVWFRPNQFAFVSGLLATAAMLGAIFGEAPLSLLMTHVGWRHTLRFCAYLGFGLAILYFLIVRDKNTKQSLHPAETPLITLESLLSVIHNKQNWIIMLYGGLAFVPLAVFGGLWGNPFFEETYHLTRTTAAALISFVFFGLAAGGPMMGIISDYLGNRRSVMIFGSTVSLITITLVIYVNSMPLWIATTLLFIFGFSTGSFMLGFAVAKENNSLELAATVIALINTGEALLGGFTEPLIGKLLDLGHHASFDTQKPVLFGLSDYHQAFLIIPLYLFFALVLAILIREKKLH